MGLWVVLLLALAGPKANRTPKALLILIPLAVVSLGWFVFRVQMGGNQSDNVQFRIMIHALAIGSAVLWLLAHWFATGGWYKTLLAAAVASGVAVVAGLSLGMDSGERLIAMAFIAVMMAATILGYALALCGYRARRAWRFLAWQAVGTITFSFAAVFLTALIPFFILDNGLGSLGKFLMFMIPAGLVIGVVAFLIALPFAILGLYCPFFRRRLILCLGEPSPMGPAGAALG